MATQGSNLLKPRRVLGIDPGSQKTGFGILVVQGTSIQCIAGGCLRLQGDTIPKRLHCLLKGIQEIVELYQPTEVAIESIFVHKNANSALKLGQARGVALAAVMAHNLPVSEYPPRQVKLAVVGTGSAEKAQVQHMIQHLLKLDSKPQEDAADALAIALCHAHAEMGLGAMLRAKSSFSRRRSKNRTTAWLKK